MHAYSKHARLLRYSAILAMGYNNSCLGHLQLWVFRHISDCIRFHNDSFSATYTSKLHVGRATWYKNKFDPNEAICHILDCPSSRHPIARFITRLVCYT